MTDNDLIDEALATMVRKSGVKVQKDDPILLNALVIQTLFREQAELARQMSEEMIRAGEANLEASSSKFTAILAENTKARKANDGIFLDSLREILAKQASQKSDINPLAEMFFAKLKGRFTIFFVLQIILMVILVGAVALVMS